MRRAERAYVQPVGCGSCAIGNHERILDIACGPQRFSSRKGRGARGDTGRRWREVGRGGAADGLIATVNGLLLADAVDGFQGVFHAKWFVDVAVDFVLGLNLAETQFVGAGTDDDFDVGTDLA